MMRWVVFEIVGINLDSMSQKGATITEAGLSLEWFLVSDL